MALGLIPYILTRAILLLGWSAIVRGVGGAPPMVPSPPPGGEPGPAPDVPVSLVVTVLNKAGRRRGPQGPLWPSANLALEAAATLQSRHNIPER